MPRLQVNDRLEQGVQALRQLSLQFVSFLMEEGFKGRALDSIIAAFGRNRTVIVSSVLGSAGVAGGAWAALAAWSGSTGVWGSLAVSLGFVTTPVWVPVA